VNGEGLLKMSELAERSGVSSVEPERAVEIVESGAEPLRELIGAMHSKQLLSELRRRRR